jgi:hypothetical protein
MSPKQKQYSYHQDETIGIVTPRAMAKVWLFGPVVTLPALVEDAVGGTVFDVPVFVLEVPVVEDLGTLPVN